MNSSERQIENLIYKYAERLDDGDFDGMAELLQYAEIGSGDGDVQLLGAEAVAAVYRSMVIIHPNRTPMTHHVTTNLIIEIDEDDCFATSRGYFTVLQATEELPLQPIVIGRYRDEFSRVDDQWRFASRRMTMQSTGKTSYHLANETGNST